MNFELINHEGHLAIASPWDASWERPVMARTVWVNLGIRYEEWAFSKCERLEWRGGNFFIAYFDGRTSTIDTTDWTPVFEEKAVPPPGKGGKGWQWAWHLGKWIKEYDANRFS